MVSRTSVEQYSETEFQILEIGGQLGVKYLLEGTVLRAGEHVRINLQLIDAQTDTHLWADTYEPVLTPQNVSDVLIQVVEAVAQELDIELRADDLARAARRTTTSPEAYDFFLRGREEWGRGSIGDAARLLDRAVQFDPTFVVAQSLKAEVYSWIYQNEPTEENAQAAYRAAQEAIELGPYSEDAQMAMRWYLYRVERDYDEALEWFVRASGTLRGDDRYHSAKAYVERRAGRWSGAVASLQTAARLSPGSRVLRNELAGTLIRMRRYDEARRWLDECLEVTLVQGYCHPNQGWLAWMLGETPEAWRKLSSATQRWELAMVSGEYRNALALLEDLPEVASGQYRWYPRELFAAWTYERLGQESEAEEAFEAAAASLELQVQADPEDERFHSALGLAYAGLGRRQDAVREAEAAVELMPVNRDAMAGPNFLFALGLVRAQVGDSGGALRVLENLLTIPSRYSAGNLRNHYLLLPLHDDPEFLVLLEREPGRVF